MPTTKTRNSLRAVAGRSHKNRYSMKRPWQVLRQSPQSVHELPGFLALMCSGRMASYLQALVQAQQKSQFLSMRRRKGGHLSNECGHEPNGTPHGAVNHLAGPPRPHHYDPEPRQTESETKRRGQDGGYPKHAQEKGNSNHEAQDQDLQLQTVLGHGSGSAHLVRCHTIPHPEIAEVGTPCGANQDRGAEEKIGHEMDGPPV